jgi:hypothetical protein
VHKKKSQKDTGKDSEVKKKTIHDYTGEELDALYESDPEEHERLWTEAELEAINNPENHGKSN